MAVFYHDYTEVMDLGEAYQRYHLIISGVHDINRFITGDVNPDFLDKAPWAHFSILNYHFFPH